MDIENELKKWSSIKFNGEMRYRKEDVIAFAEHFQALQLQQGGVSGSFSAEDMIEAFNAGGKPIYECEANGKDKKCYCRNDNDCNHRHYISAEEWLKNYR